MLKGVIIDDESKSRESLQILLQDFCKNVEIKALCQNVSEGLQAISEHRPDVVFLDIQMQRETGFDLLNRLKNIDFEVIFTTAYSEYAIKAFKFSAIDYLLKPIDIEELARALEKVEKKVNGNMSLRLEQLIQNLKPAVSPQYKLALPASDGLVFVKIDDILYCEASSNYTNIHTGDGKKHIVSRTLKEYDDLLGDHNFFRIHNSYLINMNAIKKYVRGDGGYVIMNNDVSLDVSKRKKEAFLGRLGH
ncbi:LytTR family DNA-binding domain-containing protein [Fulvivirgaceae bacterium PWU4]|uniref:LytTR family DNA-binding domain-containing protein n=1 Tax=Chryseosolibacter histidini TaxID=2782349 RepID=A0AAP2DSS0_9BACT|nr:LytTR family DNA-binding domain-containing protein [Chryseosolibacter histidini]MBT1700648.1 LytTR family DNA-binding domain-containing protein [Chryseosolibacter histidini]